MRRLMSGIVAVGLSIGMAGTAWAIHNQPRLIQINDWDSALALLSATQARVKMMYQAWYQSPVDGSVTSKSNTHWGYLIQLRNDAPVEKGVQEYYAYSDLKSYVSSGRTYETVCMKVYRIPSLIKTGCSAGLDVTGQPSRWISTMALGSDSFTMLKNSESEHTFEQEARSKVTGYTYTRNGLANSTKVHKITLGYAKSRRTSTEFTVDQIKKIKQWFSLGRFPVAGFPQPEFFILDDIMNVACSIFGCGQDVKMVFDQFIFSPSSTAPFTTTYKLINDYLVVS